MIVYITTQGSRIIREGRHLLVRKGNDTYHTLFTYRLSQLLLMGNVEITHGARCLLLRNGIDTVFLSKNGRYLGRLAAEESKNIFLRKRQFDRLNDPGFCLKTAKAIVAGKMANMATLLFRIKRTRRIGEAGAKGREIQNLLTPLYAADDIDSVRGYEGRATAIYFSAFKHGFTEPVNFTRRVRRPPTDPVNSVLSLLYTFLMNRVYAAVRIVGLDPYPGFLHSIDYGRYSLVLDLMEEFRSIVAETLTLSLFNLKILQDGDFRIEEPAEPVAPDNQCEEAVPDVSADPIGRINMEDAAKEVFDLPEQRIDHEPVSADRLNGKRPVRLVPDAFTRVIEAFEKKLSTTFHYAPEGRTITYGEALVRQAAHFRKVIEGEADTYQPLLLR